MTTAAVIIYLRCVEAYLGDHDPHGPRQLLSRGARKNTAGIKLTKEKQRADSIKGKMMRDRLTEVGL